MLNRAIHITNDDLEKLGKDFVRRAYSVPLETPEDAEILSRCKALLELDYKVVEMNNAGGVLCAHYPSRIFLCVDELRPHPESNDTMKNEALNFETESEVLQLRNQIIKARIGRCRARFPVPVILYRGKNICRSGTTASYKEIVGRSAVEIIGSYLTGTSETEFENRDDEEQFNQPNESNKPDDANKPDLGLEDNIRQQDIQLLRMYDVNTIFDLMVEYKKVKYGLYVSSSEKADPMNRYSDFNVIAVPFPGCEFFNQIRDRNATSSYLIFDWEQKMVDKTLTLSEIDSFQNLGIDWKEYKKWNVMKLTMNYLLFILRYLEGSKSGILIHCISGWDRTPLFISLVRMSLWADGLIHQSLSPTQMVYFTLAYDWKFFGHNLPNRLAKQEEIMLFCFLMLKYISPQEFSLKSSSSNGKSPQTTPKKDSSSDNGNMECTEDELTSTLCSASSPVAEYKQKVDPNDVESKVIIKVDPPEQEEFDFSGEILLERTPPRDKEGDSDISGSRSNESNGNDIDNERDRSPRGATRTSPFGKLGKNGNKDDKDSSGEGDWITVNYAGSVGSNDGVAKQDREKKLNEVRLQFYNVYYKSIPIEYKVGPGLFNQTLANVVEFMDAALQAPLSLS